MQHSETVAISGHLMDSGALARILDDVLEYGGDYVIDRIDVGKTHDDQSYARIDVVADTADSLARLLMRLQTHGANMVDPGEAVLRPAEQDGFDPTKTSNRAQARRTAPRAGWSSRASRSPPPSFA